MGTVEVEESAGKTIGNYMRNRKINGAYHDENIVKTDIKSHPNVNFRYLVYETVGHASALSELEFDGDKTWPMQEQGRTDAQNALKAGPGIHFELLENWSNNQELRNEFETFGSFLSYLQ